LEQYTAEDVLRESSKKKGCAPFCTISCVHQTAMVDEFREKPRETLAGIIDRRKARDPEWQAPISVRLLEWMFLQDSRRRHRWGVIASRLFRLKPKRPGI
jgi:hypothetical protein